MLTGSPVVRPVLTPDSVASLVARHYGFAGSATGLTGERDANFHFIREDGCEFVFKANCTPAGDAGMDLPDRIMLHVERADPAIPLPRVHRPPSGASRIPLRDEGGRPAEAMLCTYIPGVPLMEVPRSPQQRTQCAQWLARIGQALRDYEDPACHRHLVWDVRRFSEVEGLAHRLGDVPRRVELEGFMASFARRAAPVLEGVRRQVVHNDLNARNVIVDGDDPTHVAGVIDFGDAVHTALVADVAVGAVGQLSDAETALEAIGQFVAAYVAVEPLADDELAIVNWLVAARLVTNYVVVSLLREQQPDGGHFSAFGPGFFAWRVELALQLAADPRSVLRWL